LSGGDVSAPPGPSARARVRMTVDCAAAGRPINPLIYGIAGDDPNGQLGVSGRRWGGNPNTRYNWQLGYAWNAGQDWFFRNVNYAGRPESIWELWLQENRKRGYASVFTLPTIGWVAKDADSYSFPVSVLGPQQAVAPENPDIGNGVGRDGKPLDPLPPSRTSVEAPPAFIARWVSAIRQKDQPRTVRGYILDNEPTLWNATHRDVHPAPVTYDELLERHVSCGSAVRKADPEAVISGFVAWGWTALQYSAEDAKAGIGAHPDRRAHGNVPLLPWWLRKVREHEKRTGVRLVDLVDVHFYPQGAGIG